MRRIFAALMIAGLGVGPAVAGAAEDALIAADKAFSDKSAKDGPVAAFAAYAAPDARMFSGKGKLLKGADAVAAQTRETYGDGKGVSLTWTPAEAVASADGTMGFTTGQWVFTVTPGPSVPPMTITGVYMTVWARQPDGSYKFTYDGGESEKAAEK